MIDAVEQEDKLAKFRGLEPERVGMTDAAKAKLRSQNEIDRAAKQADTAFAATFKKLPKDTWTLVQVLKRIFKSDQTAMTVDGVKTPTLTPAVLERMTNKLLSALAHGWVPSSVSDVVFLAELSQDEQLMTDDKFYSGLEDNAPSTPVQLNAKTGEIVHLNSRGQRSLLPSGGIDINGLSGERKERIAEIGLDKWLDGMEKPQSSDKVSDTKPVTPAKAKGDWWTAERCRENRLCKSGSLCVHATTRGKPASAASGRQFCGDVCQGALPIRLRNKAARELQN